MQRNTIRTNRLHCVITGAADGIGKALAQRFAAADYTITGIDINAEQAEQTQAALSQHGAAASFIMADLANAADVERVAAALSAGPPIDVFIHNAGISAIGHFAGADLARQQAVIDLNLLAPLLLTADLLRRNSMAARGSLVFISSLSHFVSYPGATVYAASKDGVAAYARSIHTAVARRGLHILTVYPGPTRTAHARRYSPDNRREQRRMPPEQLADLIYQAVQRRRHVLIPGRGNQLFATLGQYVPALTEWLLRRAILDRLR